jgi:hypothetical protein
MHAGRAVTARSLARGAITITVLLFCLTGVTAGCGKKGPPLAPLSRIPEGVSALAVQRVGDDVFLTFRVPARNVDGSQPPALTGVDVLALTADAPPSDAVFLQRGARIASLMVVVPPAKNTKKATAPFQLPAGALAPGDEMTVSETLDAQTRAAASAAGTMRRYYMAVASGPRRRSGVPGKAASVSIDSPPAPPSVVDLEYGADDVSVSWSASAGAAGYNVYRSASAEPVQSATEPIPGASAAGKAARPVPTNAKPLEKPPYREPVVFGQQVCYRIRALRTEAIGELSEGYASAPVCRTPRDTFAPAPPVDVSARAGTGEITVIWSANSEPDLGGYLVLRGRAGDDTLLPITASPVKETRFVDRNVTPDERYVYAVVAVDSQSPVPNRSAPSASDEATAR